MHIFFILMEQVTGSKISWQKITSKVDQFYMKKVDQFYLTIYT